MARRRRRRLRAVVGTDDAVTAPRPILGFAHRGGMADRPENSLAAFASALARGATALEADVRLGPDRAPVLSHGAPGPGALSLVELFDVCGTAFDLSLDLPDEAVPAVVAVARAAAHDPDRLWLCGSGHRLQTWHELAPQVRLVSDARLHHLVPGRPARLALLRRWGVSAVNLRRSRWTAGAVHRVHAAGLLAFGWDVQTPGQLRRALAVGLDGVYSDHVDLLVTGTGGQERGR